MVKYYMRKCIFSSSRPNALMVCRNDGKGDDDKYNNNNEIRYKMCSVETQL